ncbi:sigma-70 family RNA polymerase sigma factor [Nonomuraea sp. MCN248]|uniref:Sigma-70 family RNA polymerase sigma factor n=1 Tax=Nonomuraea corallina TaxID=2989783 RepID=A0ABT4SEA9_9ACTN|nr:sigma-70 family RNA polymerase sigma factor [Nonomuraea corallina]MDA0635526.1 sigma-70 family RNA polymerase sigma factor [Nonomuraea corallina]
MSEQDDRSRFEAVYRRTYEQILGYAVRRCSSPENAADVVTETSVIAWQRIAEFPDGEAGKLWLYGVARRVLANHRRSERRRLTRHTELTEEIEHLYAARSHDSEQPGVDEAMSMLADSDRELPALAANGRQAELRLSTSYQAIGWTDDRPELPGRRM